jgi:hypothetical protein
LLTPSREDRGAFTGAVNALSGRGGLHEKEVGMRLNTLRKVIVIPLALVSSLVGATSAQSDDGFAVYEDWKTSDQIRGDRWAGVSNSAQDTEKEQRGHHVHLRLRREGIAGTDFGFFGAGVALAAVNPTAIDRFDVEAKVKSIELVGCAANQFEGLVRPVQLSLNKFNDGTPGAPGDFTGDHFGRLLLARSSHSVDPPDTLQAQLFVYRCANAVCSVITAVPGSPVILPETVTVGAKARLRLVWDPSNNQFLGSVNGVQAAASYPPALNNGPARVPFAQVGIFNTGLNCMAQAGLADATTIIGEVLTNPSAVIP